MSGDAEFERVVGLYYSALYKFAFSLSGRESDAGDLTQQTFYIWAVKREQIRDSSKVKSWLFTTLHREFLQKTARITRFPELGLEQSEPDLPEIASEARIRADSTAVREALERIDPVFRGAVALFYLEDYTYPEIADVLEIPLGTVKSRISRGIAQLQRELVGDAIPAGRRNAR
jgi:RNA polymerase sigma factor (sigma-70 family)